MATPSLTQSQLKELLHYDPDTGIFTNNVDRNYCALSGAQAGHLHIATGYVYICINKKDYLAHRLAWFYMFDVWPSGQLDHINRVRHDNQIANLREVTDSQNSQNTKIRVNNTSGVKGIYWDSSAEGWRAQITVNHITHSLGRFKNLNEAIIARKQAEEQLHTHRSVA